MSWLIIFYTYKPKPPKHVTTEAELIKLMSLYKKRRVKFAVCEVGATLFDFS